MKKQSAWVDRFVWGRMKAPQSRLHLDSLSWVDSWVKVSHLFTCFPRKCCWTLVFIVSGDRWRRKNSPSNTHAPRQRETYNACREQVQEIVLHRHSNKGLAPLRKAEIRHSKELLQSSQTTVNRQHEQSKHQTPVQSQPMSQVAQTQY